jgi:hypothetical protein
MKNAILVMLTLTAAPVWAEQSMQTPRSSARFGVQRPAQSDPFRKLFAPRMGFQPSIETPAATPKVVCGTTMVPADPSIDPKMLFPRKADGVDYKIRVLTPPICNPSH